MRASSLTVESGRSQGRSFQERASEGRREIGGAVLKTLRNHQNGPALPRAVPQEALKRGSAVVWKRSGGVSGGHAPEGRRKKPSDLH